jgi:hypothetical protein
MYCYKTHIIGHDDKGVYVGKLIGDIIQRKHYISKSKAVELLKRWMKKESCE